MRYNMFYILQACPLNHYGENCTLMCNAPKEGYRCETEECNCNTWACNVSITSTSCITSEGELLRKSEKNYEHILFKENNLEGSCTYCLTIISDYDI